jgi:hypothetical protein
MLAHMVASYRSYRDARFPLIARLLIPCLAAPDCRVCEAIYAFFTRFPSDHTAVGLDILLRDLRTPFIANSVFAFLLSRPGLLLSTELFELLVCLIARKPIVHQVIAACCRADAASCRAFLMVERQWLLERRVPAGWKIVILAAVVTHPAVAPMLAERTDLGGFCTAVFAHGGADLTESLALILRKVPVSDRLLWNFQKAKFFPTFVDAIKRASKETTVRAGVYMIDAISRIQMVPEFLSLIPLLINRMQDPDASTALGALSAIAVMSTDPAPQAAMNAAGFHFGLLDRFAVVERAKPYVEAIEECMGRSK